ncbi:MAG: hypothetical protein QGH45_01885 [Myxococcota bacterium]|nr:hypothetical protein [Myxococcota bacterium]
MSVDDFEASRAAAVAELERELANSPPLPDEETLAHRSCEQDDDCVYVVNGCCDCVNGGRDLAIHRDHVSSFRERFVCSGRCTMVAAVVPCGSGTVSCVEGLCAYERASLSFPLPREPEG